MIRSFKAKLLLMVAALLSHPIRPLLSADPLPQIVKITDDANRFLEPEGDLEVMVGTTIEITFEFPQDQEIGIDGFYLYRSSANSTNQGGLLGPYKKVATLAPNERSLKLSAPAGQYAYFVACQRSGKPLPGSSQLRIRFLVP